MLQEIKFRPLSGWIPLMVWLGVLFGVPSWFVYQVLNYGDPEVWQILLLPATIIAGIITPFGFQAVAPNDARALLLFGNYVGSITSRVSFG